MKAKENFADNHFNIILRLFDVLPNFLFITRETDLTFKFLGNWEISGKSENLIE